MSGSVRKKTRSRNGIHRTESARSEGQHRAQWSNQEYTLDEILDQFSLPQIIQTNQESRTIPSDKALPFSFTDPILLYDKRTVRKLLARNVHFDPSTKRYCETNETIVIPGDYDGLFLRLQSRTCKDETCHKTIADLAANIVKAFVNMTKITAFKIGENVKTNDYTKVEYTPGNVFIIERICTGTTRTKKDVVQHSYLKCKDEKDIQILIPFNHPGEFSEVILHNGKMSMTSDNLIANQKFPVLVRFISSRHKPRLKHFSGLFALIDSFDESTVIGCVINPKWFTMFELPVSSPMTFHLALNSQDLYHHPVVKHSLRLCDAKGKQYSKDMKYKSKFAHRIVQLSGKKLSTPRNDDDDEPKSALDSARFGVSTTFVYL